jgi:EmrB/QacA subfamily drug resistance transporter
MLALLVLSLGNFVIIMDTTIINTAVPSIINSLHASINEVLWVINAYLLVFAALIIACGRLGDMIGPRTAFISGLGIFTVASGLGGLSQSPAELIAARALQGAGAALLIPQALVLISAMFPPERRGAALGIFAGIAGVATISGPTLGGLLVTEASWRWVFYINVPIGVVAAILSVLLVPALRPGARHRFDVPGVGLSALGLAALGFGLIEGQYYSWGTIAGPVSIPLIMAAGVVLLAAFVVWELRYPEPLLPWQLLRDRSFAIAVIINAVVAFSLFGLLLSYVILTQSALGMSALRSGLTALPMTVTLFIFAPVSGRITDRAGGRGLLAAGLFIAALGVLALALVESGSATSETFIVALAVVGAGTGIVFAPSVTEAMRVAPPELMAAASGAVNTARQVGGALGAAVVGAVLQTRLAAGMHTLALARDGQLRAGIRPEFITALSAATKQGLEAQSAANFGLHVPGASPADTAQVTVLTREVFVDAYATAMHSALAVVIGVLAAGAVAALFMHRRAQASASPAAVQLDPPAASHAIDH